MKIKEHIQIGPNGPDHPLEKAFAADVLGAFVEKQPHVQDWKPKWECGARKSCLPEPADCNWPFCGCDPYADKVMDALTESGFKIVKAEPAGLARIHSALVSAKQVLRHYAKIEYDEDNQPQPNAACDVEQMCKEALFELDKIMSEPTDEPDEDEAA